MPAGSGRSHLPGLSRSARHRLTGGLVAAYLLAAVAVVADRSALPVPTWLALHLLLLGAASTAILVYSRHFALALLHARPDGERAADARVLALNVGTVLVLAGVCTGVDAAVGAGAGVVALVVLGHVLSLWRLHAASRFGGRLGLTVWYYVGAGLSLLVGAVIGGLLGAGAVAEGSTYEALHVAHAQVNLLGWVGLTVVGTLFMLWPAVLRTRMVDTAPRRARQVLVVTTAGLYLAVAALLAHAPLVAAAGVAAYATGVALSLEPFVRTAVQRPPHSGASWLLASATGWFVVALGVDVWALAVRPLGDETLAGVVPLVAVGVVAPVLVGALAFLLPVTVGGGPLGNRRLTAQLDLGWPVRTAAGNVGVLLVALPTSGWLLTAGWALALAGWGSGAALTAFGVVTHRRG